MTRRKVDSPRFSGRYLVIEAQAAADGATIGRNVPTAGVLPATLKDVRGICSRDLLWRLLKGHAPDDARQQLAQRAVEHLELPGFEIDEGEQVMRKRPPTANHG